jgi:hypothetical protein
MPQARASGGAARRQAGRPRCRALCSDDQWLSSFVLWAEAAWIFGWYSGSLLSGVSWQQRAHSSASRRAVFVVVGPATSAHRSSPRAGGRGPRRMPAQSAGVALLRRARRSHQAATLAWLVGRGIRQPCFFALYGCRSRSCIDIDSPLLENEYAWRRCTVYSTQQRIVVCGSSDVERTHTRVPAVQA